VDPVIRKRGIFEAILYRAELKMEGSFTNVDPGQFKTEQEGKPLWEQAFISVAISDMKGVDNALKMKVNDQEIFLLPGVELKGFSSGVHASVKGAGAGKPLHFSLNLAVNGSGALNFVPVGLRQNVNLTSTWASPSFGGAILPKNSQVTAKGFEANWEGSYYGRKYPQAWTQLGSGSVLSETSAAEAQFGVRFLNVVDHYRSVERAIKYGILFILLIFMVFFLFELVTKLRVHVFQYILVGAALCLFYLALLSLSELMSFGLSYLAAALACALMVSLYSLNILKSGIRTITLGLGMLLTYGFLYVILQMEDYSLIAGTAGLFLSLGAVMYATRHVNWYGEEETRDPSPLSGN
jgi:inner membrane protein